MTELRPVVDPLFLAFQRALAGRYSIDRELGRGGMGVVYLAREVHLDRLVAIKLLPPARAAEPGLRERFLREARLAARLSHPNIIPIHAVEDVQTPAGGFVFYVMAFVDGETLAQRVHARGPLPPSEGTRVLREVAWALAHAHAQGLVHRDVKPDNILLEHGSGRVLVADFGIAAAVGDAAGGTAGTPECMSPEQVLGTAVDARSDLYGLGATAYYAFTGRFPIEGGSATETLARQVTEPAPALASSGGHVPRKVAALVDRCLAKEPAQRPASAEALAEQLGVALEQRRELPAALRSFVKRYGRLDGSGTLLGGMALLAGGIAVSATVGMYTGFTALVLGSTLGPFGYLVSAARRLTRLGFAHQDIGPAFRAEIEQAREELGIAHGATQRRIERWLGPLARASAMVSVGSLALSFVNIPYSPTARLVVGMLPWGIFLGGATATGATLLLLSLRQRHRDIDSEFWQRVWMGRIGRAAFAVARKLLGSRATGPAMTHRATELSLGLAAEQLWEGLPKATRQALGDVPALLKRLQADATLLRQRHDALHEALGDLGDAAAEARHADLRETRAQVAAKLTETVGALETIRLDLLRLHAGSVSVASLTTQLDLAAELSAGVERLIAAHAETDQLLALPRHEVATPV